jgi:hypothetical protein
MPPLGGADADDLGRSWKWKWGGARSFGVRGKSERTKIGRAESDDVKRKWSGSGAAGARGGVKPWGHGTALARLGEGSP